MRSWLPRIKVSRDDERLHYYWTTGFAALALDDRVTYARFAGYRGGALQEPDRTVAGPPRGPFPFEPGQTFQFGCGSIATVLDGSNLDHLTSLSLGRGRASGLGISPSA